MKSILLISHGPLAEGLIKTLEMFFGNDIPQLTSLTLKKDDNPEDFKNCLLDKVNEIDEGDGVIVFADLLGGTPCNQSIYIDNPNVTIITGMNLPMVMECLGMRYGDNIDIDAVIEAGKNGIVNFSSVVAMKKNKRRNRKDNE